MSLVDELDEFQSFRPLMTCVVFGPSVLRHPGQSHGRQRPQHRHLRLRPGPDRPAGDEVFIQPDGVSGTSTLWVTTTSSRPFNSIVFVQPLITGSLKGLTGH